MSNSSPIADRGISPSSQYSNRNEVGAPSAEGLWGRASVPDFDRGCGHVRGRDSHLRRNLLNLGQREAAVGFRREAFLTLGCPAKDLAELLFGEPLARA